jgi:hypothetical protein
MRSDNLIEKKTKKITKPIFLSKEKKLILNDEIKNIYKKTNDQPALTF